MPETPPIPEFLDFEIEIGPGQGAEYPIAVVSSPAGEAQATMQFPFDDLALESHLDKLQIALLRSGSKNRMALSDEEQTVKEFGQALFDALLTGEVRTRYDVSQIQAASQGKGLRLRLRIHPPELASLPWEFLFDSREADYVSLSRSTPVVRYIEVAQPVQPLTVTPPLRILGMIASPKDLPDLDVATEKQRLERALQGLQERGLAELTWLEGQTWRDLQTALRGGPWHVFHFVGHGAFDENRDEGLVALADEEGQSQLLTATQLGRLLNDHQTLQLVVLNACEGARSSKRDIFSGTASILVQRGVPVVVAMQYAISDRAAIELSRAFYEALADGFPVDAAISEARKAISMSANNSLEWGTPVLYMRASDGLLFKFTHNKPARHAPHEDKTPPVTTGTVASGLAVPATNVGTALPLTPAPQSSPTLPTSEPTLASPPVNLPSQSPTPGSGGGARPPGPAVALPPATQPQPAAQPKPIWQGWLQQPRNLGLASLLAGGVVFLCLLFFVGSFIFKGLSPKPPATLTPTNLGSTSKTPTVPPSATATPEITSEGSVVRRITPTPTLLPDRIITLGPLQVYTPVTTFGDASKWLKVYFTDPYPSDNLTNGVDQYVVPVIDNAARTIEVATFDLNLPSVINALVKAKQERGVTVRVVYDGENGSHTLNNTLTNNLAFDGVKTLTDAGIEVVDGGRASGLMHDKFIIVDAKVMFTGSWNVSYNDTFRNDNNLLQITTPYLIANYAAKFNEMFIEKHFGHYTTDRSVSPSFTIDGVAVENYFTPADDMMAQLLPYILGARKSIHFLAFTFSYQDLAEAMIAQNQAGIEVQGIIEDRGSTTGALPGLFCAGVPVRTDGNRYSMHHKVIIIDGSTVVTGSFNFTTSGNTINDENILVIHDRNTAALYEREYQYLLAVANPIDPAKVDCSK